MCEEGSETEGRALECGAWNAFKVLENVAVSEKTETELPIERSFLENKACRRGCLSGCQVRWDKSEFGGGEGEEEK